MNKNSIACYRGQWAFSGFHRPSDGPSATIPTHFLPHGHRTFLRAYTQSVRSIGFIARTDDRKTCMHCMHQKTDYACYAKTQLRKRLHTMHTETRIGVSVGLRARKCMQLGMHTDCIQSAYKHIKSKRERNSSSTSSLYCLSLYLLPPVFQAIIFHCPRFQAFTDPIPTHISSHESLSA